MPNCSWLYAVASFMHLYDAGNTCGLCHMRERKHFIVISRLNCCVKHDLGCSELLKLQSRLKQMFRFQHFLWVNGELRKSPVLPPEHTNCGPTWLGSTSPRAERWNAYRTLLWPVWGWSRWRSRTPRAPSSCSSEPRGASGACCSPEDLQ